MRDVDDTERQGWIAGIKDRYGIRCIGDEPDPPAAADYLGEAPPWRFAGVTPLMASPDGVHFYEQPDGMTTAEFIDSLPRPAPAPAGFESCRVYWGSHGCDLERGHVERDGTAHDCGCCECGEHHPYPDWPDEDVLCVAREPYYGPETNFYGEDATPESVGRWGQVLSDD